MRVSIQLQINGEKILGGILSGLDYGSGKGTKEGQLHIKTIRLL